jgi:hypothetical protein
VVEQRYNHSGRNNATTRYTNRNSVTTTVTQIMVRPSDAIAGKDERHHQRQHTKAEREQSHEPE